MTDLERIELAAMRLADIYEKKTGAENAFGATLFRDFADQIRSIMPEKCESCNGGGAFIGFHGTRIKCPVCGGTGFV